MMTTNDRLTTAKTTYVSTIDELPPGEGGGETRASWFANATPDEVLAGVPVGQDYKRVLGALVAKHNFQHAAKPKVVSFKTANDRELFLFAFFRELRTQTQYRYADPRNVHGRHVKLMVGRWVDRGLATATIHNYLSFLRAHCEWIGKHAMVREPAFYLGEDSPHAHRNQVAVVDKSWSSNNVDIAGKIAEVAAEDHWVGLQLELCARFGMRAKESRHFVPSEAIIPRSEAVPRDAAAFLEAKEFVRIERGTKGGRRRDVPIETPEQRELLERLRACIPRGRFVGNPALTALQAQARFYYVIRKFGIARDKLGVIAHGLRHQVANDRFEQESGTLSPVRGGPPMTSESLPARNHVTLILGHSRAQPTSAYLGRSRLGRPPRD